SEAVPKFKEGISREPLISLEFPVRFGEKANSDIPMSPRQSRKLKEKPSLEEIREIWPLLSAEERLSAFRTLGRAEVEDFLFLLSPSDKAQLILSFPEAEERTWIRFMPPDDVADLIQQTPEDQREKLLNLIDEPTRKEVNALLAYAQDVAGGLMTSQFIRLRPEMSVEEAIRYLRKQIRERIGIYYAYVLDPEQHLLGVVSFRGLLCAPPSSKVDEMMHRDPISVHDNIDQEELTRLFEYHKFMAIPVVDDEGKMKGIVTVDDIINVVQKVATEDIQKMGGMEARDAPYFQIRFFKMLRKRAGWLTVLFLSEMLTATVMGYFEGEIAKAVVLALFIPLIISSGGNSGSQATTLVIRAMALGEVKLRDWWRVLFREIGSGLALGAILATIGLFRILLWPQKKALYGEHYVFVAVTVSLSLMGVVLWGTVTGATLPFLLRRLGFDPASASAPFVATVVDVTGLIIYFTVASTVLSGILLGRTSILRF